MTRPTRAGSYLLVVLGIVAVLIARFQLGLPDPHESIRNHHIQHFVILIGGGLWGIAAARWLTAPGNDGWQRRVAWLIPALLAPMAVMFAMWPSSYDYVEANPLLHFFEHAVYVALSALTTFAGYQYARPIAWLLGGSVVVMAWLASFGYGVTPGPNPLLVDSAATPAGAGAAAGEAVYNGNCAGCHQAQGSGVPGAFPPLAGHVPRLLAVEGGRDYIVRVLVSGLQGPITVEGQEYNGSMPSWRQLSDEQIAAVLNYVGSSWGNQLPSGQEPFAATDVVASRTEQLGPQQVHQLRQELLLP